MHGVTRERGEEEDEAEQQQQQQQQQQKQHGEEMNRCDNCSNVLRAVREIRNEVNEELLRAAERHALASRKLEAATAALAFRALELDNRALEIEEQSTRLHIMQQRQQQQQRMQASNRLDTQPVGTDTRAAAALRAAQGFQAARESSLRYSAVDQVQLVSRERAVREKELLLREKESELEERERVIARREAESISAHEEALVAARSNSAHFWAHHSRLSAIVAKETEQMVRENEREREVLESVKEEARETIRSIREKVQRAKLVAHGVHDALVGEAFDVAGVTGEGSAAAAAVNGSVATELLTEADGDEEGVKNAPNGEATAPCRSERQALNGIPPSPRQPRKPR